MARYVHPHFQKTRELMRASYDYALSHHEQFLAQASAAVQKEIDKLAAKKAAAKDAAE